jgi:hypothetical protein
MKCQRNGKKTRFRPLYSKDDPNTVRYGTVTIKHRKSIATRDTNDPK